MLFDGAPPPDSRACSLPVRLLLDTRAHSLLAGRLLLRAMPVCLEAQWCSGSPAPMTVGRGLFLFFMGVRIVGCRQVGRGCCRAFRRGWGPRLYCMLRGGGNKMASACDGRKGCGSGRGLPCALEKRRPCQLGSKNHCCNSPLTRICTNNTHNSLTRHRCCPLCFHLCHFQVPAWSAVYENVEPWLPAP